MPLARRDIQDDAFLLRRIHPEQLIAEEDGSLRPTSAAFRDRNLSVDAEPVLVEMGTDWHFSLKDHPGYSLVRFSAAAARGAGQIVQHDPIPDNDAHALVLGNKPRSVINALKGSSTWVLIGEVPPQLRS